MTKIRQRKYLLAIVALVLVFAGCKGESTSTPTSPGGQGGGVTPPTNASVSVSASNANPLVNSTTVVTATVTQNNQPVANGTAVQFATSLGTFIDSNANSSIRTTANGVATVTLTSTTAGAATITATVNNVSAKTTVTFSTQPVKPPPPNTNPTITSISPVTGKPAGGDIVTITGTNFVSPVRAIFDFGNGVTKEAQVISVSATQIQVISPPVDLGTGQTAPATITIFVNAGTATEQKVSAGTPFTYQAAVLTPKITTLSPTSGPIDGGTRVTIFGEGFQQPAQVFFGSQEAQVINITFSQIIVMSPTARDTAANGSGAVTGPVDVKIINVNSATSVVATGAFRYTPKMQITSMGPTIGPITGGTRVTFDGIGFTDPVAIVIGGMAAQPIKVTGTQIIAITSPISVVNCGDHKGDSSITNVDNGDSAVLTNSFNYFVPKPVILSVSQNNVLGGPLTATVLGASGIPRLALGGIGLSITGATVNADGTVTFSTTIPTTLKLDTQVCSGGGTAPIPTAFDLVYTDAATGCASDPLTKGVTVTPPATPVLFQTPSTFTPFSATITPAVAPTVGPPPTPGTPASVTPSAPQTVTVVNTGAAPLTISSVTTAGCSNFNLGYTLPPVSLNTCDIFPIIAVYKGTTTPGTDSCTVTLNTNAGVKTLSLLGTSQ